MIEVASNKESAISRKRARRRRDQRKLASWRIAQKVRSGKKRKKIRHFDSCQRDESTDIISPRCRMTPQGISARLASHGRIYARRVCARVKYVRTDAETARPPPPCAVHPDLVRVQKREFKCKTFDCCRLDPFSIRLLLSGYACTRGIHRV